MKSTTLAALCAAALIPTLAHAQAGQHMGAPRGAPMGQPMHMTPMGPHMMWGMDDTCPMAEPRLQSYPWRTPMTDAQREKAEQIYDKAQTRQRAQYEQLRAAQTRLRDALNAPKRDRTAIMNAYREVERLRQQQFETNLDAQQEFDQLLGK